MLNFWYYDSLRMKTISGTLCLVTIHRPPQVRTVRTSLIKTNICLVNAVSHTVDTGVQ